MGYRCEAPHIYAEHEAAPRYPLCETTVPRQPQPGTWADSSPYGFFILMMLSVNPGTVRFVHISHCLSRVVRNAVASAHPYRRRCGRIDLKFEQRGYRGAARLQFLVSSSGRAAYSYRGEEAPGLRSGTAIFLRSDFPVESGEIPWNRNSSRH